MIENDLSIGLDTSMLKLYMEENGGLDNWSFFGPDLSTSIPAPISKQPCTLTNTVKVSSGVLKIPVQNSGPVSVEAFGLNGRMIWRRKRMGYEGKELEFDLNGITGKTVILQISDTTGKRALKTASFGF